MSNINIIKNNSDINLSFSPEQNNNIKNILIIFYGETYRNGEQMSRNRNSNYNTVYNQNITTQSHLNLINYIKYNLNYKCDNVLFTYKMNNELDNLLINMYKPIQSEFIDDIFNPPWNYNKLGITMLKYLSTYFKNIIIEKNYDNVLFIRFDFYIKKYFYECLCFDDKIRFAFPDLNSSFNKNFEDFKEINKLNYENNEDFNVCHCICQYPKKFYFLLFDYEILGDFHSVYMTLMKNNTINISKNDIDFFIKTFHTSTSNLSWNPIFSNNGRKELLQYIDHITYRNKFLENNISYYVNSGKIFYDKENKYKILYANLINSEILPWSVL